MTLEIRVLTHSNIVYDGSIAELILPTRTGQVGILPGHSSYTTLVDVGPLIFRKASDSNWAGIALIGGLASVQSNRVTIWVTRAQSADSIDRQNAEKLLAEAVSALNTATTEKDKIEASLSFKRARALTAVCAITK